MFLKLHSFIFLNIHDINIIIFNIHIFLKNLNSVKIICLYFEFWYHILFRFEFLAEFVKHLDVVHKDIIMFRITCFSIHLFWHNIKFLSLYYFIIFSLN
jgi:hypothetical protein